MIIVTATFLLPVIVMCNEPMFSCETKSFVMVDAHHKETRQYKITSILYGISSTQCHLRCSKNRDKCHYVKEKVISTRLVCEFMIEDNLDQIDSDDLDFRIHDLVLRKFLEILPCNKYIQDPIQINSPDSLELLTGVPATIVCTASHRNESIEGVTLQIEQRLISSPYTPVADDNGKCLICIVSLYGCKKFNTTHLKVTTLMQRRVNGTVDFYRDWLDYKNGFGDINGNFWFGLEKSHQLMLNQNITLQFHLWNGNDYYFVEYSEVTLSDEDGNYKLDYMGFQGNTTDAMLDRCKGQMFSTKDRDNDLKNTHCSVEFGSGWWMKDCFYGNLNGKYGSTKVAEGLLWYPITGWYGSLSKTEIRIKINP